MKKNYLYTFTETTSTALEDDSADHIIYSGSVHGGKKNNRDLLNLFQFNKLKPKGGQYLIHNGYMVDSFDPSKLQEGDMTEVLYDYSIRKVWDLQVSELRTYKSTLDKKTKYLIHPPKQSDDNMINYRDDIDIFVYKKDPKTKQVKGLYYHRNMEDSVRMVTHRDYGLPVPYVIDYIQALDPHYDLNDFYIRIFVRQNGPIKPLVTDVNKLRSLYVLPDDKIINAMVQVNSTLKEWTADHLERSAYTAVMRSYREELTPALILDATGYTETAKLLANPNVLITKDANGNYFKLPDGLHKEVTVFEYNRNGVLLGWYNQEQYRKYYPYNKDCVFIEAIAGKGGDDITINLTNKPFKLKENTAYRFYLAEVANNEISSEWKDNTADPRILVDLTNMECTYGFKNSGEAGVAIGDDKFLCYNQELDIRDGILDFQLTYEKEHSKALVIPPGKIDIWLNGHALVEDIDYFVDFPNVMIVSKAYIIDEKSKQSVTVRCTGFPFSVGDTLKRVKPREVGFIQYGKVSVDQHHDLHDDRLIRCVVDGGVFDPSVITFDEEGDAEVSRFALDGKPYSINLIASPGANQKTVWRITYEQGQNPMYGDNVLCKGTQDKAKGTWRLDISCGCESEKEWLEKVYYPIKPLINAYTETRAPKPRHFTLDINGTVVTYPLQSWNKVLHSRVGATDGFGVMLMWTRVEGNKQYQLGASPMSFVNLSEGGVSSHASTTVVDTTANTSTVIDIEAEVVRIVARGASQAVVEKYRALLKIIKANGLLKYKDINDLYQRIRTTDITPAQIANDVILLEEAVNLVSIEGFNRQNISGVAPASMEENTTRNNPATGTNTPARGRT